MPTVLVTGANRGLGLEFTRQYAVKGWRVLACCRNMPTEAWTDSNISAHRLNVTDHSAVERLAIELKGEAIDVLINNAGVNGQASQADRSRETQAFGNTDYDLWRKTLEINLLAPMKVAECFVEHVAASDQKKILTLSSQLGSIAQNQSGALYSYRSSKAGVNAVMKSMALDLAERGILATALHPGWVRTDLGGDNADIDVETSVAGMIEVIDRLSPDNAGDVIAYDGTVVPY